MRLAAGIVLVIAGTVWILQGFDIAFAPKSFMTGDRVWIAWGAVAVLLGAFLVLLHRRSNRRDNLSE